MICDDNRDENCQQRCSRREFLRTAGGIALALLLPGCRQGALPSVSVPTAGGWIETARYKKSPPWRLGRASRGDISSW